MGNWSSKSKKASTPRIYGIKRKHSVEPSFQRYEEARPVQVTLNECIEHYIRALLSTPHNYPHTGVDNVCDAALALQWSWKGCGVAMFLHFDLTVMAADECVRLVSQPLRDEIDRTLRTCSVASAFATWVSETGTTHTLFVYYRRQQDNKVHQVFLDPTGSLKFMATKRGPTTNANTYFATKHLCYEDGTCEVVNQRAGQMLAQLIPTQGIRNASLEACVLFAAVSLRFNTRRHGEVYEGIRSALLTDDGNNNIRIWSQGLQVQPRGDAHIRLLEHLAIYIPTGFRPPVCGVFEGSAPCQEKPCGEWALCSRHLHQTLSINDCTYNKGVFGDRPGQGIRGIGTPNPIHDLHKVGYPLPIGTVVYLNVNMNPSDVEQLMNDKHEDTLTILRCDGFLDKPQFEQGLSKLGEILTHVPWWNHSNVLIQLYYDPNGGSFDDDDLDKILLTIPTVEPLNFAVVLSQREACAKPRVPFQPLMLVISFVGESEVNDRTRRFMKGVSFSRMPRTLSVSINTFNRDDLKWIQRVGKTGGVSLNTPLPATGSDDMERLFELVGLALSENWSGSFRKSVNYQFEIKRGLELVFSDEYGYLGPPEDISLSSGVLLSGKPSLARNFGRLYAARSGVANAWQLYEEPKYEQTWLPPRDLDIAHQKEQPTQTKTRVPMEDSDSDDDEDGILF